jgi:hypothetical protein
MAGIERVKIHTDALGPQEISGPFEFGVNYRVFSNVEITGVSLSNAPEARQGFRLHRTDGEAALAVDGRLFNLVMRDCSVRNVRGDGLYATAIKGGMIENCSFSVTAGDGADAVQFAFERDETNISRDIWLRGNILVHDRDSASSKGGLVCERTENYLVENCLIEGPNFGFSSIGTGAVVRSCLMRGAILNDYSFGYGVSEQHHLSDHHLYDCWIENCNRGVSFSAFGDNDVEGDGVSGFRRTDMVVHDTIFNECDTAIFADRPWSGALYRNIYMNCGRPIQAMGRGSQSPRSGVRQGQIVGPLHRNDGSFLCEEPPRLSLDAAGQCLVEGGRWSNEPDAITYIWRSGGFDLPLPSVPSIRFEPGHELSCVVLARRGDNWMLSIAETAWDLEGYRPRAWQEGHLPWQNRYARA